MCIFRHILYVIHQGNTSCSRMPCSGILRSLTHQLSQATCKPSTCAQHIQPSQYPLVLSLRPQLRLIATTLHIIGFVGDVLGVAGRGVLIPLGLPSCAFPEGNAVFKKSSLSHPFNAFPV